MATNTMVRVATALVAALSFFAIAALSGCRGDFSLQPANPKPAPPIVTLPFVQEITCERFRVIVKKAPSPDVMLVVNGATQSTIDVHPGEGFTIMARGGFAERYELVQIQDDAALFRRLTREDKTAEGRGVRTRAEVVLVRSTEPLEVIPQASHDSVVTTEDE
ncbi:MAG: hypothetical protein KDA32_00810 [Phycisphaerales bacterium]|nr:hypothetical protein [Phycisphaerales bacterium]